MGILRELLGELEGDNNADKIRELCDRIAEEEKRNIENFTILPQGPNIFLALEVPGRIRNEIAFLTLERESEDKYLLVLYTVIGKTSNLKRQKVWEVDDHRPEKILTDYTKQYKFLRGE